MNTLIAPTNKPVFGAETPNINAPKVILSVDWLTMTAHVGEKNQDYLKSYLIDLPTLVEGCVQIQSLKSEYRIIIRKSVSKNVWYQIEGWPFKKTPAFLRISFQPSMLGPDLIEELKKLIDHMFYSGFAEFADIARVTRIDVAADCKHVGINDLGFLPSHVHKSAVYLSAKHGVETIYIGTKTSASQFRIYEKALQQKEVNNVDAPTSTVRIERRLKGHRPYLSLLKLPNPLAALNVTSHPLSVPDVDQDLVRVFNLAARSAGTPAAFSVLSKSRKKLFRAAIQEQNVSWWKPAELWSQWPALLADLGLTTGVASGKPKVLAA